MSEDGKAADLQGRGDTEGSWIQGTGLGGLIASVTELSQRKSDFMRKDTVSSWMGTPQGPALSKRMRGMKIDTKVKINPKCADGLGWGWAAPGAEVAPGTREQLPVMTLFIFTFRYYNKTLNDKG